MLKRSLLSLTILLYISGCTLDGDDGVNGTTGPQGAAGIEGKVGSDGLDATTSLDIVLVGRAVLGAEDPEGAAEIVAFQKSKGWVYAINSSASPAVVEIIDINGIDGAALTSDAEGIITNTNLSSAITLNLSIDAEDNAPDANSIAIDDNNEILAVAMAGEPGTNGNIAFYDISGANPVFVKNVEVGDLPDMVAFSPDGSKVIVANEGEPSGDYKTDPEGSISIINLTSGIPADTAINISFKAYNDKKAELQAQGVVFASPSGTTVAQDLEPEYVTISENGETAYVSMQEANALAVVNLNDNSVKVIGLGFKDWSDLVIDVSDKDGGMNLKNYPGLYGMYQPDTIANFKWKGADFIVTANEGDGREYLFDVADEAACSSAGGLDYDEDDGCLSFIDEIRVEDLALSANFDYTTNDDAGIGRLKVTTFLGADDGSTDGSGTYSELYTYGARSFTIWDSNGLVVFDSGDEIERITASIHGEAFNNDEDENEGDTRSDAKGPEPEALALGTIGTQTYAFVGLERMGGIMVYDITNPYNSQFVDYFYNRGTVEGADYTGDLAPEGMKFISAEDSPTGEALLVIGNEISGSVAIWEIKQQ